MVNENLAPTVLYTSTTHPSTTTNPNRGYPVPREEDGRSSRDTVTAVTVAILAVIMVITIILVVHAIRKLRHARRRRERPIPAISTEIMEIPAATYSDSSLQSRPSPAVTWEPIETQQHSLELYPSETNPSGSSFINAAFSPTPA